ncbi:hypothetical protein NP493_153g00004 [Ridgeia piscesae]|uniref:Uncharacterized protein n=1 Tax=Ridgeia piscesae TaxID=27915 RepID=A0AAD9P440_RIDPI|nr:hypothetical protein NP493_153g00004 [Ridgeia piscesae]
MNILVKYLSSFTSDELNQPVMSSLLRKTTRPTSQAVIPTWIVSESSSLAAKALKMVASLSAPFLSMAFAVRPCSVKLPYVVSMSVYSPRPLKVYWKPSSVRICGSPKNQPVSVKQMSKLKVNT